MAVVNPMMNPNVKDSRWLTLEVCREHQRNKCTRTENECKFAHPPPHVEVQNGRVIACFDSIKGKCQRKEPPCKYLHPPQHLREQLLQNGRNNLILRSMQMHAYHPHMIGPSIIPVAAPIKPTVPPAGAKALAYPTTMVPGQIPYVAAAVPQSRPAHVSHPASYVTFASSSSATVPTPQYLTTVPTTAVAQFNPYGLPTVAAMQSGAAEGTIVTSQFPGVITSSVPNKASARPDRLEPQVVEVVPQSKKRLRDSAEELVLPPYVIPPYKRLAMDGGGGFGGKGGLPTIYQPSAIPASASAAAAAYQQAALMQLQQQPSYPLGYSSDMMSAAYTNYLPQVAGHPPSVPRF